MGTKEDILGAKDTEILPIEIPEWGGMFYIRVLDGTDRDALVTAHQKLGGEASTSPSRIAAETVGRCMCGEDGTPLFKENEYAALASRNSKVLDRVAYAALDLNGLTEAAMKKIVGN